MYHKDPLDESREYFVDGLIDQAIDRERYGEVHAMTDDQLFDALRDQVNRSRNGIGHDRELTRFIGAEMDRRGWNKRPANLHELGRLLKDGVAEALKVEEVESEAKQNVPPTTP